MVEAVEEGHHEAAAAAAEAARRHLPKRPLCLLNRDVKRGQDAAVRLQGLQRRAKQRLRCRAADLAAPACTLAARTHFCLATTTCDL